ncbi:MAG: OmpA family protein [Pseudomonadota bacterium]
MLSVVPPHARRLLLPALLVLALPGCATKEYVQQELAWVNSRLEGIENTLGHADKRINANTSRLSATESRLGKAEQDAAALDRKLGETQQDLAATNNNVAGLLMGLNAANLRIDSNVEKIQTAEQRLAQTQQEAAVIQKRLDDTQGDLEGAKQNLAGLLVGLNQANARIDAQAATLAGDTRATGAVAAFTPSQPGADATPGAGSTPAAAAPEASPAAAAAPVAAPPSPSLALAGAGQKAVTADATPAQGALLGSEMQERLARVNVLIDEVHRRITVNTSSLQNANVRIGALEAGLAAASQRSEEADATLKATRDKVDAAQAGLEAADKRIAANTTALEAMGPHIDTLRAEMQGANGRLDGLQARLADVDAHLLRNDAEHAHLSRTAQEALDRALAAGKLAEGRLVMETVLSEAIGFGFGQSGLSESGRLALLAFADKLKSMDQDVYVEIQGHTDSSGPEEANLRLSRQRAEAVRDFLHQQGGLSLHRLAVAAYGESRPVADNATRDGRIQNRRVVLVVLK